MAGCILLASLMVLAFPLRWSRAVAQQLQAASAAGAAAGGEKEGTAWGSGSGISQQGSQPAVERQPADGDG